MLTALVNVGKEVTGINYVMSNLKYYAASLVNPYAADKVQNFILASQEPLNTGAYVISGKFLFGAKFNNENINFIYATSSYSVEKTVADSAAKVFGYIDISNAKVKKQATSNNNGEMIVLENCVIGTQKLNPASNVIATVLIRSNQYTDLVKNYQEQVNDNTIGLLIEGSLNIKTIVNGNQFKTDFIVTALKFETVQGLNAIKATTQQFDALFGSEEQLLEDKIEETKKSSRKRSSKKDKVVTETSEEDFF